MEEIKFHIHRNRKKHLRAKYEVCPEEGFEQSENEILKRLKKTRIFSFEPYGNLPDFTDETKQMKPQISNEIDS